VVEQTDQTKWELQDKFQDDVPSGLSKDMTKRWVWAWAGGGERGEEGEGDGRVWGNQGIALYPGKDVGRSRGDDSLRMYGWDEWAWCSQGER